MAKDNYMNDVPSGKGKNSPDAKGMTDNIRGNKMAEKSTFNGDIQPQPKGKSPAADNKNMSRAGDGDE